ncbi:MAG: sugar-binding protein [Armatimonadia bacterium]
MRILTVSLLMLGLVLPALAADDLPINVYPAPRADVAPVLDGKLDDALWQQAPLVSGFTLFGTDTLADVQSSFRLLWDDKYLYLGIRNDEPNMARLVPVLHAHDEHAVFSTETIEFFLDPNHSHEAYYQLAFNAAGSLYDGFREDTSWNSGATVKAYRDADFWSVEIAVPWKPMDGKPAAGKVVGFNVNRDRHLGVDKQWCTWAKVQNGFHDPERFAHAVLSGTPEQIGKLQKEIRKGDRTGPIMVYSHEGFAKDSYTGLAAASLAQLQKLLTDLRAEQKREKDPGASAELDKRLAEFEQLVGTYQQRAAGKLDAAEWIRLDRDMQQAVASLQRVVSEARLTALLQSI